MKPFKLADYFIKVNLFSIFDMKSSIDFRQTVETGLDPRLLLTVIKTSEKTSWFSDLYIFEKILYSQQLTAVKRDTTFLTVGM